MIERAAYRLSITKDDNDVLIALINPFRCESLNPGCRFSPARKMPRKASKHQQLDHCEFVSGFIPLHILHHATQKPLVGFWMIEELRRHGYEMSPGTIYPLLHSLQKKGYLSVELKREGSRAWREYSATKQGKKVLTAAKRKLRELFHELME